MSKYQSLRVVGSHNQITQIIGFINLLNKEYDQKNKADFYIETPEELEVRVCGLINVCREESELNTAWDAGMGVVEGSNNKKNIEQ